MILCPPDFPGKSTGVGCHFLLQTEVIPKGQRLDQLGPEVTFPIVNSFLENATEMFRIFSSNLCLLGVSVYN